MFGIDSGICGRANGLGADQKNVTIQSMASNEFPWLVYLYFDNSDEDGVWCSGSIIGSKWILTSASCLDVYRYYTIVSQWYSNSLPSLMYLEAAVTCMDSSVFTVWTRE